MKDTTFLYETTEHLKPRAIALGAALIIAISLITWVGITQGAYLPSLDELLSAEGANSLTVLIAGFLSGLFFLPVPTEIFFINAVRNGASIPISMAGAIAGFTVGLIISYFIGMKLSHVVNYFVSPKKMYGLRRKVNRYGAYAVFLCNALPGPGPQLTFALGITRYNFTRLMSVMLIGVLVKYSVLSAFLLLSAQVF